MAEDNVKAQMRKGILEYCILAILSREDSYAPKIIAELKQAEMIVVEGTLYPILTRQKNAGLLTSVISNLFFGRNSLILSTSLESISVHVISANVESLFSAHFVAVPVYSTPFAVRTAATAPGIFISKVNVSIIFPPEPAI